MFSRNECLFTLYKLVIPPVTILSRPKTNDYCILLMTN